MEPLQISSPLSNVMWLSLAAECLVWNETPQTTIFLYALTFGRLFTKKLIQGVVAPEVTVEWRVE